MFTVKYINPTGQEMLSGPFDSIGCEFVDAEGEHVDSDAPPPRYRVIRCYKDGESAATLTLGPNIPMENDSVSDGQCVPHLPGRAFVMNEQGATVAKYTL